MSINTLLASVYCICVTYENDIQPPSQFICRQSHDLMIGVLEQRLTRHSYLDM